jgi:type I restriction enzyme R subunit
MGHRFADYGLLIRGKPAAVVEAKKTSRDARLGQEQALQYAQALHRRDGGALPFVMYTNGLELFYWDSELYAPAAVMGFPTRDDLEWQVERRVSRRPLSVELINPRIAGPNARAKTIEEPNA